MFSKKKKAVGRPQTSLSKKVKMKNGEEHKYYEIEEKNDNENENDNVNANINININENNDEKNQGQNEPEKTQANEPMTQLSPEELERLEKECKAADEHILIRQLSVNDSIWEDVWAQFSLLDSPAVLDNTAEIVVQYGYIMLFVVVFPLMFVLAIVNNFVEFRLDFYELTQSRRSVPYAASGIGVWKQVLSAFGTVAVFSNMAIITWRTSLGTINFTNSEETNKVVYFFVISFMLLLFQFIMRFCIPDVTTETQEALDRQEVFYLYVYNYMLPLLYLFLLYYQFSIVFLNVTFCEFYKCKINMSFVEIYYV
ncbi:hypothetical protein RFI_15317 [Reticulomyxa filosa]|uniref:Anoctamin transmembrane domain-containing protein n=1 Tax=Reticulomyxa filosa TaxID=46433 RepID=X6N828_RETFI|nr:hypothetical protein RFI_15317 [Reticulomyxa filosa]|eukprot:ETO21884.1 hypothetical protein RFI_15317 [Reticulomyxa filosa]